MQKRRYESCRRRSSYFFFSCDIIYDINFAPRGPPGSCKTTTAALPASCARDIIALCLNAATNARSLVVFEKKGFFFKKPSVGWCVYAFEYNIHILEGKSTRERKRRKESRDFCRQKRKKSDSIFGRAGQSFSFI